jgi:hypothetical protein
MQRLILSSESVRGSDQGSPVSMVFMNSSTSRPLGDNKGPRHTHAPWFLLGWRETFAWIHGRLRPRRLLFLDDDPARAHAFLTDYPQAVWVETVPDCIVRLAEKWDEVHLDHDLGGQTYVDTNQIDCGMEVIRWICTEPRTHLRETLFVVHTHNSVAGLLMVLQMRASGYNAEFRPFGVELARLLAQNGSGATGPARTSARPGARFLGWLKRLFWRETESQLGTSTPSDSELKRGV